MRYEQPRIVHRERIDAMAAFIVSFFSDIDSKENILPIAW